MFVVAADAQWRNVRLSHAGPMAGEERAEWWPQAAWVAAACQEAIARLLGVYVHGSAALGGFGPNSDLDMLIVVDGGADWQALAARLLGQPHARPLELSVVEADACAHPAAPWPYLLHVNSAESRVAVDLGRGDPDLVAHYAVTRAAGVAITGPGPAAVFGAVPHAQLVAYLRDELQWAVQNADQRYAVLNACRATAYARDRVLLSKPDGARWWLQHVRPEPLVEEALAAQLQGRDLGSTSRAAEAFVASSIASL